MNGPLCFISIIFGTESHTHVCEALTEGLYPDGNGATTYCTTNIFQAVQPAPAPLWIGLWTRAKQCITPHRLTSTTSISSSEQEHFTPQDALSSGLHEFAAQEYKRHLAASRQNVFPCNRAGYGENITLRYLIAYQMLHTCHKDDK